MAANYNQFKQAWDMMDENQRKQQTELYKDNQQFQQFAQQYSNEKNNSNNTGTVNNTTGANNNSNSNNGNGSNGHYDPIYYRNEENNSNSSSSSNNSSSDRSYYENNGYSSDGKNGDGGFYGKTNFDKEETLDKSMFNEAPGKITIEAGTGKDTGRPDYEVWDAARETEMKKNLDEYYATMPHLFRDRDTFNKFFEYNKRESDAQRELLDSYWKKAQNDKAANTYTNSDQLKLGFSNGDVTPDILDAIKYNNPDLYAQWEKAMQDDLNARIANYAVPRTATDTADIWMDLVKKLGLEAGDPYQIYDNWVGRCEELGVFNMNNQLSSYISEMEQVKGERTAAMQRVMTQGAGRKSQALIDAQVAKTSSLYDARFADLQNMYQATYNQRQQNLAIANQSAQMLQAQAAEDQRIFNNKITALGFAMKVDDYRTPEQKSQNDLRFNAINNDLQLLNKAKSNDLELYNKYATAKLENQLNYEMQDLTVTDPKQLRANLSNVLDQWYEQYGDIIERPKSQVIEDVLAYAKENGVSVGEALRQEFVKKLMEKPEYQQSIKDTYGMNSKTTFQKIGDTLVGLTVNPDGTYQVKNLGYYGTNGVSGVGVGATSSSSVAGNQWSNGNQTKLGESVVDTGIANVYGGTVKLAPTVGAKLQNAIDSLKAQGIDLKIGDSYRSYETQKAAYEKDQALPVDQRKGVAAPGKSFHEIGQAIDISQSQMNDPKVVQALLNAGFTRPVKSEPRHWSYGEGADQFGGVSQSTSRFASDPNWNDNGYFKSLEPDYKKYLADGKPALTDSKWKSLLQTYNLSEKEFREQAQAYAETGLMTSGGKQAASALESALKLYEYVNGNKDGFFGDSLQAGWSDRLQANIPGTAQYDAKSEYNTLMARLQLNELFSAKENGASFGSMSDSEWDILGSAATNLDWGNSASVFKEKLEDIIGALELSVKDANVPMPSNYKDSSYVNGGNSKINSSGVVVKVPTYGNGTIAPMTYNPYETEWNNYPG